MKNITIGFSKPLKMTFKVYAWLVMKAFGTNYDHVYIKIYSDSLDRTLIYQASGLVVNFMSSNIFESNNQTVAEVELSISQDNYQAMMQFAIDNLGKPYGIKEALGMAIVRISEIIFRKQIKNPFRDNRSTYVCSELVSYILKQFAQVKITRDLYDMTPKDVYETVMQLKGQA